MPKPIPFNISIMDVDEFVEREFCQEVTSSMIHATSSDELHPDGLFSESIFGELGTPERLTRFAFIPLHTSIMHPHLYRALIKLNSLHSKIIKGESYAVFNKTKGEFEARPEDDVDASTGYSFFIKHASKLQFAPRDSIDRNNMIKAFDKYRDNLLIDKMIVAPAGVRDISTSDDGRDVYDDINKLYMTIINVSKALDTGNATTDDLYDPVRINLQNKVEEVYLYIENLLKGKKGFLQSKYSARAIALGTRNVITADTATAASVDHPALLRSDEVLVPLFQALVAFRPLVVNKVLSIFTKNIFDMHADQSAVINPKTLELEYVSIPTKEKSMYLVSEKIGDLISAARDNHVKFMPVSVRDETKKRYYLYLKYETSDDVVFLGRGKRELQEFVESEGYAFEVDRISPLNYFEMFYLAIMQVMPKNAIMTRYPVSSENSTLTLKVHIATTAEFKTIKLGPKNPNGNYMELHRWPVGKEVINAMSTHVSHLPLQGGD